jgi:hypothetical protein
MFHVQLPVNAGTKYNNRSEEKKRHGKQKVTMVVKTRRNIPVD